MQARWRAKLSNRVPKSRRACQVGTTARLIVAARREAQSRSAAPAENSANDCAMTIMGSI
ncbi:hypothetical protein CQW49_13655 [Methylosinus trichosporium OB3b]|uniref:Uncharacterized protein n=1 Tax=Methylosinus trichosporium (strain ATCC 35070 / NCIMB 11131 / UNIQEM 75 / OB3b) TaxID=595536 RepID=A0A2D2D1F3_METT3|nr:hypothetical protein CQW49_13655 [Methylosinus trichosporium OB3b]OBS51494.1 hypothetical protein A8B73_16020 [Methylosinus sp. 3S-1]